MKNNKIAVMRFSALGDIAATIPVLRALKSKPLIITSPMGKTLLEDEFDEFLILKDKKIASVLSLIWKIRSVKIDTLLDFQCNDRSFLISKFSNANVFDNRTIDRQNSKNIFFDIANQTDLVSPLDFSFEKKEKSYIVLNCGSSHKWLSKRLPEKKWVEFSKLLYEQLNLPIIMTGDESEKDYINSIAKKLYGSIEVVAGKTTIQELKKILKNAYLTISTDSATMHISAVQKTPTIGLFGATNWIKSAPFGPWSTVVFDKNYYKEGIPPSKSLQSIDNYYEYISIKEALNEMIKRNEN